MQGRETFVFIVLALIVSAPAKAADTWQNIAAQGRSAEIQKNPQRTIMLFEKALSILPAANLEQKIKIEGSLVNAYRELGQISKASAHCSSMLQAINAMKRTQTLSSDVIYTVHEVVDAPEHPLPDNMSEAARKQANLTVQLESMDLCQAANPEFITTRRLHNLAHAYVGTNNLPKALYWLNQCIKQPGLAQDSKERYILEKSILEAKLGHPEALKNLKKPNSPKSSQQLAFAAIFAQDYTLAKATLDNAYKQLPKGKNKSEEYYLLGDYIEYFEDRNDKQGQEIYLRKRIALLQLPQCGIHDASIQLPNQLDALAQLLKTQNRNQEALQAFNQANAIRFERRKRAKNLGEREFFLSDKDKEELAKVKEKSTK